MPPAILPSLMIHNRQVTNSRCAHLEWQIWLLLKRVLSWCVSSIASQKCLWCPKRLDRVIDMNGPKACGWDYMAQRSIHTDGTSFQPAWNMQIKISKVRGEDFKSIHYILMGQTFGSFETRIVEYVYRNTHTETKTHKFKRKSFQLTWNIFYKTNHCSLAPSVDLRLF